MSNNEINKNVLLESIPQAKDEQILINLNNNGGGVILPYIQGAEAGDSENLVNSQHDANAAQHEQNNLKILQDCSLHLHANGLVAFPTETVYGLRANALSEEAVLSIFKAKKRPLTDPVIVHVLDVEQALPLVDFGADKQEAQYMEQIYRFFAKTFWPGPLTLVTKSNAKIIPSCITAQTGFVGIRCPKHPVARRLIEVSKLPIAAPSANRFGHVSPTLAQHVMEDLGDSQYKILIIDGGAQVCHVGIESTVAKIEIVADEHHKPRIFITVLRKGGISVAQIETAVKDFFSENYKHEPAPFHITVQTHFKKVANNTTIGQAAPGQLITHYAPDVQTYLFDVNDKLPHDLELKQQISLSQVVIVDFYAQLASSKQSALQYLTLSDSGSIKEAAAALFDKLRQTEKIAGAKAVLLANVEPWMGQEKHLEHADALFDRMFRAASGRLAKIQNGCIVVEDKKDEHLEQ